jgi:cytochrome c peroxidase
MYRTISFIPVALVLTVASFTQEAHVLKPLPLKVTVDARKVQLGKKLFFDTKLSRDNTISCATCHDLKNGGDDGMRSSFGINGQKGNINAPTVYNAVYNFRQFWDGRAKDLKEQALGPIVDPLEMGNTVDNAIKTLSKDPAYVASFNAIYPDGITKENLADAIAEFEKRLVTPNAPFDRYLRGDKNAISRQAERGYKLFKYKGCIICHNGMNIGGNLYNKFGIYKDANTTQLGRYNITKRESDKFVFKVPSLRNVSRTAPYMHDGRFRTLEEAVKFMAHYQLGRLMEKDEVDAVVAFLKTLDGELPSIVKEKP